MTTKALKKSFPIGWLVTLVVLLLGAASLVTMLSSVPSTKFNEVLAQSVPTNQWIKYTLPRGSSGYVITIQSRANLPSTLQETPLFTVQIRSQDIEVPTDPILYRTNTTKLRDPGRPFIQSAWSQVDSPSDPFPRTILVSNPRSRWFSIAKPIRSSAQVDIRISGPSAHQALLRIHSVSRTPEWNQGSNWVRKPRVERDQQNLPGKSLSLKEMRALGRWTFQQRFPDANYPKVYLTERLLDQWIIVADDQLKLAKPGKPLVLEVHTERELVSFCGQVLIESTNGDSQIKIVSWNNQSQAVLPAIRLTRQEGVFALDLERGRYEVIPEFPVALTKGSATDPCRPEGSETSTFVEESTLGQPTAVDHPTVFKIPRTDAQIAYRFRVHQLKSQPTAVTWQIFDASGRPLTSPNSPWHAPVAAQGEWWTQGERRGETVGNDLVFQFPTEAAEIRWNAGSPVLISGAMRWEGNVFQRQQPNSSSWEGGQVWSPIQAANSDDHSSANLRLRPKKPEAPKGTSWVGLTPSGLVPSESVFTEATSETGSWFTVKTGIRYEQSHVGAPEFHYLNRTKKTQQFVDKSKCSVPIHPGQGAFFLNSQGKTPWTFQVPAVPVRVFTNLRPLTPQTSWNKKRFFRLKSRLSFPVNPWNEPARKNLTISVASPTHPKLVVTVKSQRPRQLQPYFERTTSRQQPPFYDTGKVTQIAGRTLNIYQAAIALKSDVVQFGTGVTVERLDYNDSESSFYLSLGSFDFGTSWSIARTESFQVMSTPCNNTESL